MDYRVEPESEGLRLDIEALDKADLRLIGGEVSLAGTSSPPRLEVDGVTDEAVMVRLDGGELTVEQPAMFAGRRVRPRATVTLTMPPAAPAAVRTESAALVAAGLGGEMSFSTVSGELAGTCLSGDVRARTISGEVALDGVAGRLHVESVSGPVTVVGGLVQELVIGTVTGEVVADLDPRPGARCTCRTASGPVTVRLPADASAFFEAESLAGHIDVPDMAETFEDDPPPWARAWPGMAQAWSQTAQTWSETARAWAGRAGDWAGHAGDWAEALVGASSRFLGDTPSTWASGCVRGLGRVVRGRLGQGDANLSLVTLVGDITMVSGAPAEAVA
ncbi:MAG TPA: hypothetical protein VG476_09515 [Acidimicrobiales bacterium]|nr:hypothetical protein [Acidimicrobiales bacterium]